MEPKEAERIANELATLLAQEHRQLVLEREKRAEASTIASELAAQLALDRAELRREREARERAEAQANELSALVIGEAEDEAARFVPAPSRGTRRFHRVV